MLLWNGARSWEYSKGKTELALDGICILWHMAWIYVYVCVWRERHPIVNILDDDSDYTMEMMRRTRTKGAERGILMRSLKD